MKIEELEKIILERLNKGLLDGIVGKDFSTGGYSEVIYRKIIKDGIPQILRFGADSKFFNNKENVLVPGKKGVELFKTVSEQLSFLQKYGFLINDPDVKAYSALFRPKNK